MAKEILIGRIAVERGFITQKDLDAAVEAQGRSNPRRPLGEILVEQGILTRAQVEALLSDRTATLEKKDSVLPRTKGESLFGKLALELGLVTEDQLNEALREQAAGEDAGRFRQLGDVLVEMGVLSPASVRRILESQERSLLWCEQCEAVFNVAHVVKRTARCPNCGTVLVEAREDQVSAEAQIAFTPEGMRVASLVPTAEGEPEEARPVGTIVARKFRCGGCGGEYVALINRGARSTNCPACKRPVPLA